MQDKRLSYDPMYGLRYQDKRRFPQGNPEHGRVWNKKLNCFISNPLQCRLGGTSDDSHGNGRLPCNACLAAIRASKPAPMPQPKPQPIARKRLTGIELTKAYFRP